jgi:hypothetical protein
MLGDKMLGVKMFGVKMFCEFECSAVADLPGTAALSGTTAQSGIADLL